MMKMQGTVKAIEIAPLTMNNHLQPAQACWSTGMGRLVAGDSKTCILIPPSPRPVAGKKKNQFSPWHSGVLASSIAIADIISCGRSKSQVSILYLLNDPLSMCSVMSTQQHGSMKSRWCR
jgi:hypothetical protein